MNHAARNAIILVVISVFSLVSAIASAPFDESKLDEQVSIEFRRASMADAILMISNAADIGIVGPTEPMNGITMVMHDQTVRAILDALAAGSGTQWSIENEIVVIHRRPLAMMSQKPTEASKTEVHFGPEDGMAEMVASLTPGQFFRVTGGNTLNYSELTDYQKQVLKSMLSPPTVGIRDTEEVIRNLPAMEEAGITFLTMPYIVVAGQDGNKTMDMRLDTLPYIMLKRTTE